MFVAEGANLGAVLLLKAAPGLGLSAEDRRRVWRQAFAGDPNGRVLHRRQVSAALDEAGLSKPGEALMLKGTRETFACAKRPADGIPGMHNQA